MDSFGTFLYQSGISIAVFYLFYWALLRKETWFSLNRILLFGSLLLAVAIPFVRITLHSAPEPGTIYYAVDRYFMNGVIVRPSTLAESAGIRFTAGKVLLLLYLVGVLFFLLRFLIQIFQVLHLVRKYGIREFKGYRIVPVDKEISPFSFFTLIFINTGKMKEPELQSILLHEWEHVRRLHTLDIILLEIVCIIQWFNPFIWLYKYSLHELHEYEADQAVLRHGENRLNYQKIILNQAFGHNFFPVVHNLINRSFIKKRLIMITRRKSRNITLLKSLLILPVAALLLVSFSFTRKPDNLRQIKQRINGNRETVTQAGERDIPIRNTPVPEIQKDTNRAVFFIVEEMPKFQGGDISKFREWVARHLKYPESAAEKGIGGKVYVQFIVEPDGRVDQVKVVKGVDSVLDAEAVRVIRSSPLWTPGKQKGRNVPVAFTMPMVFVADQTGTSGNTVAPVSPPGDNIFFIVEEMPKFQGGTVDDFKVWVSKHIRYPEEALAKGISGRVFVQFVVGTDGTVDNVKVIKSADPLLGKEAVRVVKSSPGWTPGMQRGHKVRVAYTIPVTFVTDHAVPSREPMKFPRDKYTVYVIDGKKASPEQIKNLDTYPVARILKISTDQDDLEKYGDKDTKTVIFLSSYWQVPSGSVPPKPKPPKK